MKVQRIDHVHIVVKDLEAINFDAILQENIVTN